MTMRDNIFRELASKARVPLLLWLFVGGTIAAVWAQSLDFGSVDGIVIESGTNAPLAGVSITLMAGSKQFSATTDGDGKFSIMRVPPGRYMATVAKTGFMVPPRPPGPAVLVSVASGQYVHDVRLDLLALSAITGRISDQNGDPVRAVPVVAFHRGFSHGERVLIATGTSALTNDRGEFRVFNIPPGDYFLAAGFPQTKRIFEPTFYPGVINPDDAMVITLSPGQDIAGMNFPVADGDLHSVRVKFVSSTVLPDNVSVRIAAKLRTRDGYATPPTTESESIGSNTYIIPKLPRGTYEIEATWGPTYGPPHPSVRFPVSISDSDVDLGTVNVGSVRAVTGRVNLPAELRSRIKVERITFVRWDNNLISLQAPVDSGGGVSVDLPEGRYRVSISSSPSDLYISSILYGNRDVLDSGLLVDSNSSGPIEINIESGNGTVEGVVRNSSGELLNDAHVVLQPSAGRRTNFDLTFVAKTNLNGTFVFYKVPPGDYVILALESLPPDAALDSEYMKQFENKAATLVVQRGARANKDLVIISNFK